MRFVTQLTFVMLDLKHMRDEIHHDFIGVSNKCTLILPLPIRLVKTILICYVICSWHTDTPEDNIYWWFIKYMDNIEK